MTSTSNAHQRRENAAKDRERELAEKIAILEATVRRARDEAQEALEQQTATAEILKVISSSPTDIEPVFGSILANAVRLCEASVGAVFTYDGEVLANVAHQNASPEFAEFLARSRPRPSRETTTRRCALERRTVHTADLLNDPEYRPLEFQRRENVRTVLSVPLIRDDRLIGVITLWRREVKVFSDKQIALVQTFADQAVIAIENARLFNETREALEQQKASGEVLAVIGSSIGDTQAVFDKILESCGRLFAGRIVGLNLVGDDGMVRLGAFHGPGRTEFEKIFPVPLDPKYSTGRAIAERRVVHYPDVENDKDVRETTRQGCRTIGIKSVVFVPVLWEGRGLGAIFAGRDHVGSFSEKETALLRSFADQAAIAIQNSRLFNETKEALDFQKATGEILASISGSITDTRPVFDAIARNLLRVFGTRFAVVELLRDGQIEVVAMQGGPGFERLAQRYPRPLDDATIGGAAMLSGKIVQCTPVIGNPRIPADIEQLARDFGFDSCIGAPMIREDKVVGAICTAHRTAVPFSDKQLALLRTFADQAVIAIENVRLFNETKEALERQTATAEILRVISGSITDTQPVFDAIVRNCQRLFGGRAVALVMPNGGMLKSVAFASEGNVKGEDDGSLKPWPFDRGSAGGACILDSRVIALPDIAEAVHTYPRIKQLALDLGYRSALFVPLMREGKAIACLAMLRAATGEFSDKEISLASTFADQAVIAIENARLFNETREALEQQKALRGVLETLSRSAFDLDAVLYTLIESTTRLSHAEKGFIFRRDGDLFRFAVAFGASEEFRDFIERNPVGIDSGTLVGRTALEGRTVHIEDAVIDPKFTAKAAQSLGRFRTMLGVPIIRDRTVIGVIALWKERVEPFTDAQIALVTSFSSQALIAIENARLFNETKEALDFQKATSEILASISGSITEAKPVFDRIARDLLRLFGTRFASVQVLRDGQIEVIAAHGEPGFERIAQHYPRPLDNGTIGGSVILSGNVVQFTPVIGNPHIPATTEQMANDFGFDSVIGAPMIRDHEVVGAIVTAHRTAIPFSDKQVALLRTFADQAVIAIENARLFSEIQDKSRQLEIANHHKSEFLANVSHELRTPLNAIIGFTRIVMRRSKEQLEPKQYENLEKILMSGQNLLALINAILDLSKVEAGRVELNPVEIELAPVLEQCVRTIEPLIDDGAVSLIKEFDARLPRIVVDEEKLRQIVINLLSNAAKFTSSGTIRVRAIAANGSVDIAVADTGIGIAADKLALIFEAFEQGDTGNTRDYGGTGLGLTIARRLARLMGGDIRVESALGSGSIFTLTLPSCYRASQA